MTDRPITEDYETALIEANVLKKKIKERERQRESEREREQERAREG